ncbi:hypothetical protein BC829DRAFT_389462 [Chytridium lagenaria]|nr:hypothetical protein BC829DRAFT_389462 [Chytridium lagenaria]
MRGIMVTVSPFLVSMDVPPPSNTYGTSARPVNPSSRIASTWYSTEYHPSSILPCPLQGASSFTFTQIRTLATPFRLSSSLQFPSTSHLSSHFFLTSSSLKKDFERVGMSSVPRRMRVSVETVVGRTYGDERMRVPVSVRVGIGGSRTIVMKMRGGMDNYIDPKIQTSHKL